MDPLSLTFHHLPAITSLFGYLVAIWKNEISGQSLLLKQKQEKNFIAVEPINMTNVGLQNPGCNNKLVISTGPVFRLIKCCFTIGSKECSLNNEVVI